MKLEDAVIATGDVYAMIGFVWVPGANITKLEVAIMKSYNIEAIKTYLNLLTLDKVTSLFERGLLPNVMLEYYSHRLHQGKTIYQDTTNQIDETWLDKKLK